MVARPDRSTLSSPFLRLRQRAGLALIDGFFHTLSMLGRWHPASRAQRRRIEVIKDIPYLPDDEPAHRCDIYRPREREGLLPTMVYMHGGGFRILSKDTHWLFGLHFALQGMVVVHLNYRLTPRHPFPDGLSDCCRAVAWTKQNASRFGGDPDRLHLAGESAGANLATSVAIASCYRRNEPWARDLFESDPQPRTVIAACGLLQVSHPERLWEHRTLPFFVKDRILSVSNAYLPDRPEVTQDQRALADPLVFLEQCDPPDRPLPAFFAFVGTKDPLEDDTRRLETALKRLRVPCRARYYLGGVHAFHVLYFTRLAQECWQDQVRFLQECGRRPCSGL